MITRLNFTLGLLFYAFVISAQVSPPIDSDEIFRNATKLNDEAKFEEGIAELDKIDRNDSNYVASLVDKSLFYIKLKKYEEASQVCLKGLKFNTKYKHKFLVNRVVALKLLKKYEEAMQVVDEGLKVYKNSHLLIFNKATLYANLEKNTEALEYYKQCLLLNPFYPNSHLNLGLMALNEGKISQAMLSLNMFLLLEPNSDRSLSVLKKLDDAVSSKYERESKNINLSAEGDDFSELDLIISNYAALAKNFKIPIKLDLAIAKQNYLLLSKLEYQKNDKGFWMQTYVPFFKALYDQNKFHDFTYFMLQSSGTEYHQNLIKKNQGLIIKFKEWAFLNMKNIQKTRMISINDKATEVDFSYNNSTGLLEQVGAKNSLGKETGYYEYFHNNGVISAKGNYNDKGEKEGMWKVYYYNGELHQELNYKQDKEDGTYKIFYGDGTLKKEGSLVNGIKEGVEKEYNTAAVLISQATFNNNICEGESFLNFDFSDKYKKFRGQYLHGEVNDTLFEYFDNGKLKKSKMMVNGKANGVEKTFYSNGKLSSEFSNVNNVQNGTYKIYHLNGKLKEEGTYVAGVIVGAYKEYHSNGKLANECTFDEKGKAQGISKFYDEDGKIFNILEYQKDEIVAYKYFNKEGIIIKEDKRKKGEFDFIGYYPEGNIKMEGIYTNKGKQGLWKYYDEYGNLTSDEVFNMQNKVEGAVKNYYSNNVLKNKTEYKNGVEQGYYVSYHENGKIKSEGYMVDGSMQGYWHYYNSDGIIESKKYYSAGKSHGFQQYFSCTGLLQREELYEGELITKFIYFDTLGVSTENTELPNGTGKYRLTYSNNVEKEKGQFIYGLNYGDFIWHHFNGKVSLTGTYHNDERTGSWKWYNEKGILITEGEYDNGKKNGKWSYYHPNGKLKQSFFCLNNDAQGDAFWYHENGQIEIKKFFIDDKEEGEANYFDEAGELQIKRYFHNGIPVSYSCFDKIGKLLPPINISISTYKVLTFYKNGNKAREYEILKGEYINLYKEYHSNGTLIKSINYKNGIYEGNRTDYYVNNIPKSDENYSVGELHGKCKYYYPNGKIEKELNYKCGSLHGSAIYYSTAGAITLTQTNYSGTVIKEK